MGLYDGLEMGVVFWYCVCFCFCFWVVVILICDLVFCFFFFGGFEGDGVLKFIRVDNWCIFILIFDYIFIIGDINWK